MATKNKKKNNKPVTLTRANENRIFSRFMILVLAYLMEEDMFDGDADKLMDFYESMLRWWSSITGKEISIRTVVKLVEERTGRKVYW